MPPAVHSIHTDTMLDTIYGMYGVYTAQLHILTSHVNECDGVSQSDFSTFFLHEFFFPRYLFLFFSVYCFNRCRIDACALVGSLHVDSNQCGGNRSYPVQCANKNKSIALT